MATSIIISGKSLVEAARSMSHLLSLEGFVCVKADPAEKVINMYGFVTRGGFFFERRTLKAEEGSIFDEDLDIVLDKGSAPYLQKLSSDDKMVSGTVSLSPGFLLISSVSKHQLDEVKEIVLNKTASLPILSRAFKPEIESIQKRLEKFNTAIKFEANALTIKEAFAAGSSCAALLGAANQELNAVFVNIDEKDKAVFAGTDGFRAAMYEAVLDGAREYAGKHTVGYGLAVMLGKYLNKKDKVLCAFVDKYLIMTIANETCSYTVGGSLLKYEHPKYEPYFNAFNSTTACTVNRALLLDLISSVYSLTEDNSFRRGNLVISKGILSVYNPLKPTDRSSGLPVASRVDRELSVNSGYISTLLKLFPNSEEISFNFTDKNEGDPVVITSASEPHVRSFFVPLRK